MPNDCWRDGPMTDGEQARLQRKARLAELANESQALGLYDVITGQHQTACDCAVTSSGAGKRGDWVVREPSKNEH